MTIKFTNVHFDESTSEHEVKASIEKQVSEMEFLEGDENIVVEVAPQEYETGQVASLFAPEGLYISISREGHKYKYTGCIPSAHKVGEYFDPVSSKNGVVAPYYSVPNNACVVMLDSYKLREDVPWGESEGRLVWRKFSKICKYRDWNGGCMLHEKCSYAACRFADV